jgi:large subunit ribosomal protein L7/L12
MFITVISLYSKSNANTQIITRDYKTMNNKNNVKELVQSITSMSVMELCDLVNTLNEQFGLPAQQTVMSAPAAEAVSGPEEQTEFDVIITKIGTNKVGAIKVLREIMSDLGIKEAKAHIDSVATAPFKLLTEVTKDKAEDIKAQFAKVDAEVEIK